MYLTSKTMVKIDHPSTDSESNATGVAMTASLPATQMTFAM